MNFISRAYAQSVDIADDVISGAPPVPSAGETFMWNMGMILALVALFYVLMIRPQQKRFKEHSEMLGALKKGDKVVTSGGLIGTIDKIKDGENDISVDLGNGTKVTVLRNNLSLYKKDA